MEANNVADSFTSGVDVEERRLIWRIKNFPVVLQHDSMVSSQKMTFYAGESIGLTSKWCAYLSSKEINGKKWIGIFIRVKERPALKSEFLFVKCEFKIRNSGEMAFIQEFESRLIDIYDVKHNSEVGFSEFADRTGKVVSVEETAVIHINLKIYSPSMIPSSPRDIVEEFRTKSKEKATQVLEALIGGKPNSDLTVVKIVSHSQSLGDDGFYGKREVFSARSPVFKAMLERSMLEANTGIVVISDISEKTLNVLLNYIYYGELLPQWKFSWILPELVIAAAKYQLPDLLGFLDKTMGKFCSLENVGVLIQLASKLSLKTAIEELLRFVRMNGTISEESILQILRSYSGFLHQTIGQDEPAKKGETGLEGGADPTTSGNGGSSCSGKRVMDGDNLVNGEMDGNKAGKQWEMIDLSLL